MEKKEKKPALPLIRYLAYLLIVTTVMTGISLSRYSTSYSMYDSARVAKFNVEVIPVGWENNEVLDIAPNGNKRLHFEIVNKSEVAVRVRLVDTYTGVPLNVTAVMNSSWITVAWDVANGWFTMTPGGTFDAKRYMMIDIVGTSVGKTVNMRMEYEQID